MCFLYLPVAEVVSCSLRLPSSPQQAAAGAAVRVLPCRLLQHALLCSVVLWLTPVERLQHPCAGLRLRTST